jgi:hypothetical protein
VSTYRDRNALMLLIGETTCLSELASRMLLVCTQLVNYCIPGYAMVRLSCSVSLAANFCQILAHSMARAATVPL